MKFRLSQIGTRMSMRTGVRRIMRDIQDTLRTSAERKFINLSPGNPVIIPEVDALWRKLTQELLASAEYSDVVGRYGMTQGYQPFIEAIVADFNSRYNLRLTEQNVLVTAGSQALYFLAANALCGRAEDGSIRELVLPLCPDYTGYGGIPIDPTCLISFQPELEVDQNTHRFKYHPNFAHLTIGSSCGAVIFSRPCNPTGNVLTDEEVKTIVDMAAQVAAPVFIDSAYAPPFPALNFAPMTPIFGDNVVHCISFSKAGLPGERVGVAIGDPELLQNLEGFESNAAIHSSRFGQAIIARAIRSGELGALSLSTIRPFYQRKFVVFEEALDAHMPRSLPWFLHRGEGSLFSWLWFDGLPIADWELYEELKKVGVLIVPGSTFFPGLRQPWRHTQECIRVSLTASDDDLREGAKRIATTIASLMRDQKEPQPSS